MQNYVNQLLADMVAAKKNLPPEINYALLYPDHPAYKFGLDYIVEWEMSPSYTMDELFGIKAEQLPPAEKLTDEQIVQLVEGMFDLWAAFNFVADTDYEAPMRVYYSTIKTHWATQPIQYHPDGINELDFCDYNTELCSWGEHCKCQDLEFDSMDDYKSTEDSELTKGIVHHENGGISWINPKFLDSNGNSDASQLPF
jgi:hypothetical protein